MNHIFFHNDIDGIMSAAILQTVEDDFENCCIYPVASTMRGGSIKKYLDKIPKEECVAIVDFEHNERANIWFDHHYNEKLGPHPVSTPKVGYDPIAKSAAQVIVNKYKMRLVMPEIVDMVNMIDSALYPDVKFIFESDHPLMILRAYLETAFPAEMTLCRIVEIITLFKCDVEKAIRKMRIDYQSVKNIRNLANNISKDMVVFGKCSVVSQTRQNQYPRYSEYLMRPELKYAVRVSISGPKQKYIQIGYNQWSDTENTVNLGELMRSIQYVKGGGHFNVAAGVIWNDDEQKFLDELDYTFNKDCEMEKYAVDKEDKVESKAQELVKTGIGLQDAREKSQQELEKSNGSGQGELRSGNDIRKAS